MTTIERIRALVDQEIASVKANIKKVSGSGVYVEHIERWHIHLEAYYKVCEMLDHAMVEAVETVAPP